MPSIHVQSLTPRIRQLVATDTYARPSAGSLTSDEVNLLTAVALGDRLEIALSPHRAIGVLAIAASPEVAIPVLEQVARNTAARSTNRVAALRGLGRIATPEAQASLLGHARDGDPRVQQAAFAALGLFADRSALDTLERLNDPGDEAARRQLSLTRALIAHRNGLDGPFLPEVTGIRREPVAPERMNTVTLAMKTAGETAADQARLSGSTYGIRLADRALALRCGRAEWTIFGNADLGTSITATDRLFERPWIAALLARWLPVGVAATTQYLVLTRPAGRSVRIDVARADGELMYTGSAEPVGSALSFAIADVNRAATAPTTLAGLLDADGVRLDVAIVYDTRVATRHTEPVRTGRSDTARSLLP